MGSVRVRKRCTKPKGFVLLLSLLLLVSVAFPGVGAGEEEAGQEERTVRNIEPSPSLTEMEKGSGWSYNGDYIFAISRTLRDSGLATAAKVPLFIPSVVLDTALLPIALIAGFFGN